MSRPRPSRMRRIAPTCRHAYRQRERLAAAPKAHSQCSDQAYAVEGYGTGYDYDHDAPDAFSGQDYFPEQLGRQKFYEPPERGFEREIAKRLEYWTKLRKERGAG